MIWGKRNIWNSLQSCPKWNSNNSDIFSLCNHTLSCSAYTGVPEVSPADLLSLKNMFWWAASAPQAVEGWPGEHRASSCSIFFRPHKATRLQSNWSGLGFCPTQKKCFRADTVTRVLLLSLALQMGNVQRAVCPQGSITVPVHRACHLLGLANYRGIVAAESTLISSHPLIFSGLCPSIRLSGNQGWSLALPLRVRPRGTRGDLPPWEGDLSHGGHGWVVVSS